MRELSALIDEGLNSLSARYRDVLIVCCLESQSRAEAAQDLGLSLRTLERRLAKAKEGLRGWLLKRGVTLSAALLATALAEEASAVSISAQTASATARAAGAFLAVGAAACAGVSTKSAALAEACLRHAATVKVTALVVGLAGLCAGGWVAGGVFRTDPLPEPLIAVARADMTESRASAASKTTNAPLTDVDGDPLPPGAVHRIGSLRFRHAGEIGLVLFTANGKELISKSYYGDRLVCVWDAASGKLLRHLPGNHRYHSAALSRDGKMLAQPRENGTGLWDVASGKLLRELPGSEGGTEGFAFSPDGDRLATAGFDGKIRFWDPKTGRETGHLIADNRRRSYLIFTPDGKKLVSADFCGDGRIEAWDLASGHRLYEVGTKNHFCNPIAVSPNGAAVAAGGDEKFLRVWSLASGKLLRQIPAEQKFVTSVAYSPDGKLLASAETGTEKASGCICLREAANDKVIRKLNGIIGRVDALAFSPDGRILASGDTEGLVRRWDVAGAREINPRKEVSAANFDVAFMPDGHTLVYGMDGRFCDTTTFQETRRLGAGSPRALSRNGEILAAADANLDFVDIWRLPGGKPTRRLRPRLPKNASQVWVRSLGITADGSTVAVGLGQSGTATHVQLWKAGSGDFIRQLECKNGPIEWTGFSPDGRILAVSGRDFLRSWATTIHAWDVATWKEEPQLATTFAIPSKEVVNFDFSDWLPARLSFSPDGKMLAANRQKSVHVWEVASGSERLKLGERADPTTAVAFSPDGRSLASAGFDGIQLWDVATRGQFAHLTGHRGAIDGLAFSPDSKILVSSGHDRTIVVWNLPSFDRKSAGRPDESHAKDEAAHWGELRDNDAAAAYREMVWMSAHQQAALPILHKYLHPAAEMNDQRVDRLIGELEDRRFAVRQNAARELVAVGAIGTRRLEDTLKRADLSPELHQHLQDILANAAVPKGDRLQVLRAVEVLEHIGTPPARRLLEQLASGAADARLTREAKASLQRLKAGSRP